MNILINPVKRTAEPTGIRIIDGFDLIAYRKNGLPIRLNSLEQPVGRDNSQAGWAISGHKFVLHGMGIMVGGLKQDETIEWIV